MTKPIVDISFYQSHQRTGEPVEDYAYVDFDAVADSVEAVILRANWGMTVDTEYMRNRDEFEERRVPLNAYGWCLPTFQPEAQGVFFGNLTQGLTTAWLDIETVPRLGFGILPLDTYMRFWDGFDRVNPTTRKGIYTNLDGASYLPDTDVRLLQFPLWLAAFGDNDGSVPNWTNGPTVPKPWARYDLWQYTDKGRIAGIDGTVDMNLIHAGTTVPYLFGIPPIVVDPIPLTIEERVTRLEAENAARRREISALAASIIAALPIKPDPVNPPPAGSKQYTVTEDTTLFIESGGKYVQVTGMKLHRGAKVSIGAQKTFTPTGHARGLFGKITNSSQSGQQVGLWVRMRDIK